MKRKRKENQRRELQIQKNKIMQRQEDEKGVWRVNHKKCCRKLKKKSSLKRKNPERLSAYGTERNIIFQIFKDYCSLQKN